VSSADKALYVYRNGNPIGRAPIEARGSLGTNVFTLLEGTTGKQSTLVPAREGRNWMRVTSEGGRMEADAVSSRLRVNPEFAAKLYDTIAPGTTVIVTDKPVIRRDKGDAAIFET